MICNGLSFYLNLLKLHSITYIQLSPQQTLRLNTIQGLTHIPFRKPYFKVAKPHTHSSEKGANHSYITSSCKVIKTNDIPQLKLIPK